MAIYTHVLVAVDFSKDTDRVGERALALARASGARLTFLHVVAAVLQEPLFDVVTSLPLDLETQLVDNAREGLARLTQRLGASDAECVVEVGTPKAAIVRSAQERGADLIVLGSHGVHGLGILLGSTANGVLHSAPCDVLAVRVEG